MTTAPETTIEPPLNRGFDTLANEDQVLRAAAALEANGMTVLRATDSADAKRIVMGLVPDGSQVYHGASQTLDITGITVALDESGRYEALGFDTFIFWPTTSPRAQLERFAREVVPAVREAVAERRRDTNADAAAAPTGRQEATHV